MIITSYKTGRILLTTIVIAIASFLPQTIVGQTAVTQTDITNDILEQASWMDNSSKKKMKDISKWQEQKGEYTKAAIRRDSLEKVSKNLEARQKELTNQQKNIQNQYSGITKGKSAKELYEMYDTTMLLLHKTMCDNDTIDALIACHRAEALLSQKYDSRKTNMALSEMQKSNAKTLLPDIAKNINDRLNNYKQNCDKLRTTLKTINDKLPKVNANFSESAKERYIIDFAEQMETNINISLLSPYDYPYLYNIIVEAIKTKKEDPSNNLDNIIKKI